MFTCFCIVGALIGLVTILILIGGSEQESERRKP